MFKNCIFSIICFYSIANSFAQQSYELADSAVWKFKMAGYDGPGNWYVSDAYEVLSENQVLLDGTYWRNFYGFSSNALIQKDSLRIVATHISDQNFVFDSVYVLYDFDLSVGDTAKDIFHASNSWNSNYHLILQSTYDTIISGTTLKVYQFNHDVWIESIGSTKSFLNPILETIALGADYLLCEYLGSYTDSTSVLYSLHLMNPSVCILTVSEVEPYEIDIYASSHSVIVSNIKEESKFHIYNSIGGMVSSGTLIQQTESISTSDLVAGLYILKLKGKSFKFIKF